MPSARHAEGDAAALRARRGVARARLVARLALARVRGRPHTLSHLVTARCNGHCRTCLWSDHGVSGTGSLGAASSVRGERAPAELDTAAVRWLYSEAGRAGMAQLVLWGGEPLLRQDLPELLLAARRAGLFTALITNGWLLSDRWSELRGLIDALILSLDDVGPAHDELRGLPGLYERLEAFVATLEADLRRPALLVNTVLSSLNRGALARVAPVAARWRAGLYFCPMETSEVTSAGMDVMLASLALPTGELREAARLAADLKRDGLPILASSSYLELLERDPALTAYRCRAPQARLTVGAGGLVRDCTRSDRPLLDVGMLRAAGEPLSSLFKSPRYRRMVERSASCTKCNNPDVIELSWLWDFRPEMLGNLARLTSL